MTKPPCASSAQPSATRTTSSLSPRLCVRRTGCAVSAPARTLSVRQATYQARPAGCASAGAASAGAASAGTTVIFIEGAP